jgi:hypothetical protein
MAASLAALMRVNFPRLFAVLGSHEASCANCLLEFGLQAVSVTSDRRDGQFLALVPGADRAVARYRIPINVEPIPLLGMTDIGDGRVVVLTPEE